MVQVMLLTMVHVMLLSLLAMAIRTSSSTSMYFDQVYTFIVLPISPISGREFPPLNPSLFQMESDGYTDVLHHHDQ